MGPYTKSQTATAIDDGWEIKDGDGEVIAILDTETMADGMLRYLESCQDPTNPAQKLESKGEQYLHYSTDGGVTWHPGDEVRIVYDRQLVALDDGDAAGQLHIVCTNEGVAQDVWVDVGDRAYSDNMGTSFATAQKIVQQLVDSPTLRMADGRRMTLPPQKERDALDALIDELQRARQQYAEHRFKYIAVEAEGGDEVPYTGLMASCSSAEVAASLLEKRPTRFSWLTLCRT